MLLRLSNFASLPHCYAIIYAGSDLQAPALPHVYPTRPLDPA